MQKIGNKEEFGYNKKDLLDAKEILEKKGYKCIFYDLNEYLQEKADEAYILVIKNGVTALLEEKELKPR